MDSVLVLLSNIVIVILIYMESHGLVQRCPLVFFLFSSLLRG